MLVMALYIGELMYKTSMNDMMINELIVSPKLNWYQEKFPTDAISGLPGLQFLYIGEPGMICSSSDFFGIPNQ